MGHVLPLPQTHLETVRMVRPDGGSFAAALCVARLAFPALGAMRGEFLHPDEEACFSAMKFERRRRSYLAGRYCAKQALCLLEPGGEARAFRITPGVFTQPIVEHPSSRAQVGISHAGDWGAALAFPEAHPMGLDIEEMDPDKAEVIRSQAAPGETPLLGKVNGEEIRALTLLWTIKEALSKALRCGMMTPFTLFEISSLEREDGRYVSAFTHFAQYKAVSFFLQDIAVSIVSPRNSALHFALGKEPHA